MIRTRYRLDSLRDGLRFGQAGAVAKDDVIAFAAVQRVVADGAVVIRQQSRWVVKEHVCYVYTRVAACGTGVNELDPRHGTVDGHVDGILARRGGIIAALAGGRVYAELAVTVRQLHFAGAAVGDHIDVDHLAGCVVGQHFHSASVVDVVHVEGHIANGLVKPQFELCFTGAVGQRFKRAVIVHAMGIALDIAGELFAVAEFLVRIVTRRKALELERDVDGAGILGEPALKVVIVVDRGTVARWVGCLGPFKAFAGVAVVALGRAITDQDVVAFATVDIIIARPCNDRIVSQTRVDRIIATTCEDDVIIGPEVAEYRVVAVNTVTAWVIIIAGVDLVALLVTVHDPVRSVGRSLGRGFLGLGGRGFSKEPQFVQKDGHIGRLQNQVRHATVVPSAVKRGCPVMGEAN